MDMLDIKTFEGWMRRIMDRLDRQDELIAALTGKERKPEKEVKLLDGERLFDNQDLCLLLQVSKRSLQRYRSIGVLPYHMLRHKTYYKESDVLAFITEHIKEFKKEDVERYKARIRTSV
ncbi:helix-turn-helix domain-containing protein [Phocaeicola sp.]